MKRSMQFLAALSHRVLILLVLDLSLVSLIHFLPSVVYAKTGVLGNADYIAKERQRLQLDIPWYQKVRVHWSELSQGSLGRSQLGGWSINSVLVERLGRSLPLWIFGIFAIALSAGAGGLFFIKKSSWLHWCVRAAIPVLLLPQFVSTLAAFALWVLIRSSVSIDLQPALQFLLAAASVAALPSAIMLSASVTEFVQLSRAPFVTTYVALGLPRHRIAIRLLRNVFLAIRGVAARATLLVVTGTCITESIFGINGFGSLFLESVRTGDLPVLQACTLVVAATVIMAGDLHYQQRGSPVSAGRA